MATYVILLNFTDQGIRNVQDSPKRAEAFKSAARLLGCAVKELLWTQGQYDAIALLEAPDDLTASAVTLTAGKLGNVTSQTLRAFTASEMEKILEKVL
jgi:uncharacterized protein with GYD domain